MPLYLLVILAVPAAALVYGGVTLTFPMTWWFLPLAVVYVVVALLVRAPKGSLEAIKGGDINSELARKAGPRLVYMSAWLIGAGALLLSLIWRPGALALLAIAAIWVIIWWPRWVRTFSLTTDIVIARERDAVFAFVSDLRNQPKYEASVESIEMVTPGPIGRGSSFRSRTRLGTSYYDTVEEIVDYQPPTRFTIRDKTQPTNSTVITCEPVPGGTQVTHRFVGELRIVDTLMAARLFAWLWTGAELRAKREATWARAKEILESGTEPPIQGGQA